MKSESDILDRIRKLLRLADRSRGSTENEAKVALAKAQELMTRHNIDSALLRMERGESGSGSFTVNKGKVDLPKTLNPADLRHEFPGVTSSLVLSVLILQFTPIEYRQQIVRRVFESLAPGEAFILVEKVLGATAKLDEAFVNLFLNIQRENGYSESQIDRKRMSLEGVLGPVTARWNEELLHQEGFTSVDCFWRHLNFAGWVAVKP